MRNLISHLRHTIRRIVKSPGFAITAILILGLGIGANTAIFSLIEAVVLKPLPYPASDRLVEVRMTGGQRGRVPWDYPDYADILPAQHSFSSLAVSRSDFFDLTGNGEPQRLAIDFASAALFKVSDLPFILGQPFTEQDDVPDGPRVAVLSESCWRSRFNSDPKVIGMSLTLSEQSFRVIGVAPDQVDNWGPPRTEVYVPLNLMSVFGYKLHQRDFHPLRCFGRLKEGVTVEQAQADLAAVYANIVTRYPDVNRGFGLRADPLLDSMVGNYSTSIWLLGAAAGCLLLISCANVAILLFARASKRRKEVTICATLGASRYQLIGRVLLEIGVLSLLGGFLGILLARWAIQVIKVLSPEDLFRFREVYIDQGVLWFVCAITVLVAIVSGLLPASNLSRPDLASALRDEGERTGTSGPERQRTQSLLVAGQVTLASILMIGTGLLARSFQAVENVPLGFNPDHVLTAEIIPSSAKYADMGLSRRFYDSVLENVRQIPGVTEAAMDEDLPFVWDSPHSDAFAVPGQADPEPGREPRLNSQRISSNYFRTLGIPLVSGRDFDSRDRAASERVVIINLALAERFFPRINPIGKQIQDLGAYDEKKVCTIIGVVQNAQHDSPDVRQTPFQAFYPYSQRIVGSEMLVVRTPGDPLALIPAIRHAVALADPEIPVVRIATFDDLIAKRFAARQVGVFLVSVFSGAALFLSAVGLYGVLAYSISQRKREIGIRIALGAESNRILRLVITQGLKIVGIGLVTGVSLTLVLAQFIQSILYRVSATDPIALVISLLVLGAAAFLACLLPALRAARINPITALRE